MLSSKITTAIVTLAVAAGITGPALAPAVSQAQTNNFGFLHSAEGFKLKNQGNQMPCQPTFPVENPAAPTGPLGPSSPVTRAGAAGVMSAQNETRATVGPLNTQTCEADSGTEVAY